MVCPCLRIRNAFGPEGHQFFWNDQGISAGRLFQAACDETGFSVSRPRRPAFRAAGYRGNRDPGRRTSPECNTNPPAARQQAPGE